MIIKPRFQLYVSRSHIKSAGRGVFAGEDITPNSIIETCPVLVVPRKDYPILKKTELRNYYFMWGKVTVGICFGYRLMYNHSYTPNATYKKTSKIKPSTLLLSKPSTKTRRSPSTITTENRIVEISFG